MTNVAIITARGGSQSIPDKNTIDICGKPALGYVIEAAREASLINEVYVTTDSEKIKEVGLKYNCRIIDRPPHLSLPDTNHGDVMAQAVDIARKEYPDLNIVTVLLGNTVMVNGKLIDLSIQILDKNPEYDSVMSVWEAGDDHPYRALKIGEDGFLESFLNIEAGTSRQYYPKVYYYDQGVWTFRYQCVYQRDGPTPWWWMGKRCFPVIRNWVTGRDFHSQLDLRIAEFWIQNNCRDEISNLAEIEKLLGKSSDVK